LHPPKSIVTPTNKDVCGSNDDTAVEAAAVLVLVEEEDKERQWLHSVLYSLLFYFRKKGKYTGEFYQ